MPKTEPVSKRHSEMLSHVMWRAIDQIGVGNIINAIQQNNWGDIVAENETPDGPLECLIHGGYATSEELKELAKPLLAEMIASAIGARNVTIEW